MVFEMTENLIGGKEPLVSVIMNCYNGERYLREAVDSVVSQTYKNWEVIFWDNQSTDKSAAIFQSYKDDRMKYFYAPSHTKIDEARNYSIGKAKGEFVAFLDVDDYWTQEKLASQIRLFDDKEVGFSCGKYVILMERTGKNSTEIEKYKGVDLPSGIVTNQLLEDNFVHLSSLVVRREHLNRLKFFSDGRYSTIGDFDLAVRLSQISKLAPVQSTVSYYRWHDNNTGHKAYLTICDQLEFWFKEAEARFEPYTLLPGYQKLKNKNRWLKIMKLIREGKKTEPIQMASHESLIRQLKVIVAVCLPNYFVKKLIG